MKRIAITLFILVAFTLSYSLNAQNGTQHRNMKQNRERIEAQKVAFITDKLDLNSAEAEKFWPVYNDYKDELKTVQKSWREEHKSTSEEIAAMPDGDAEKLAQDQLNHEQEMLDLRKGLVNKMKGVISPQKILMLFKAEKEFRVELMRKVSHGRGQGEGRSDNQRKNSN